MPNKFVTPPEEPMDAEFPPTLIPSNLWSIAYLSIPNILEAASQVNPERVGELFQAASPPPPVQTQTLFPFPCPFTFTYPLFICSPRWSSSNYNIWRICEKSENILCNTQKSVFGSRYTLP